MSNELITLFSQYENKVRLFHLGRVPVSEIDGPREEIIRRIRATSPYGNDAAKIEELVDWVIDQGASHEISPDTVRKAVREAIAYGRNSILPEVATHIEGIRLAWADYCDDLAFLPQADPKTDAVDKAIQAAMVALGSRSPKSESSK